MISSVIWIDIAGRLLGTLRSWVNPHYLGAAEYGKLGVLSAWLLFASFCDLGLTREFELTYPTSSEPRLALRRAFFGYLPSALAVIAALEAVIFHGFGKSLALAALPYLLAFGVSEIWLIVLRAEKQFTPINVASLIAALGLTLGSFWVAPRFGVLGVIWLQSTMTLISLFILSMAVRKTPRSRPALEREEGNGPAQRYGRYWLLAGQLLPLLWLAGDRIFLAKRLAPVELGYWALGSLPGALLAGVTNTAATLHMATWVRKERPWLKSSEMALFLLAVIAGTLAYGPVVKTILKDYAPGIEWNRRQILTYAGIASLFFYDGFRRSRIFSPAQAREWFLLKLGATAAGIAIAAAAGPWFFPLEPRAWVLIALQGLLFAVWIWEKRWGALMIQLALSGALFI